MNITEKILARASGQELVRPGDIAVVDVETTMMLDSSFHPNTRHTILKVADPSKVVIVFDHLVPAPDATSAAGMTYGREFARKFGIERFHDVGADQGIGHAVVAENGYALPGTVLVCSDSHTCASGAFNCAARGVGSADLYSAVTTGKIWYRVYETIRYDLVGELPQHVSGKDVFLYISQVFGDHTAYNVEFGGPGLASLSMNARRTIATMGAELSAEFAIFEPDQTLLDYMAARNGSPFDPQYADADATYADRRTVDLSAIDSLVARPGSVIQNSFPPAEIARVHIDQAFIGSCANGTLDDLAAAAHVVRGRKVAAGTRFLVTPGTQKTYREALKLGYIADLLEAGAVVTPAGCGACFGGHMGVLGPDEVCITASTRNFAGRMGDPTAKIYMGSPATVAASAIAGHIVHPQEMD